MSCIQIKFINTGIDCLFMRCARMFCYTWADIFVCLYLFQY